MTPPPPSPCDKVFTMTIGSYAEAKKLANGSYVKSNPVDVGGHSWRIAFYPNGHLAGTTASMSLFLLLDDDVEAGGADEDVHVKFTFMMLDPWAEDTIVIKSGEVAAAAFSRRLNAYGFERFVSREDFEKTALFKGDRFKIRCDLTVFPAGIQPAVEASCSGKPAPSVAKAPPPATTPKPSVARAARPSSPRTPPSASPAPSVGRASPLSAASPGPSVGRATAPPPPPPVQPESPVVGGPPTPKPPVVTATAPPSGLPADLGRLLETKEGADVEFEVCGKVFAAHKSVLAARSSVFKEKFFGPMKEKDTNYVLIGGDMHPEAFEALLHYMYTDSLPETTMTMDSLKKGAVLAEDLLNAAERYDLKDLKSLTENKLCGHVGATTVLLMLALAEQYQCCKLKKMCLGFIGSSSDTRAIMATKDVENLARSSPSVIKDVITEILETREERITLLMTVCIYAFCVVLAILVFAVVKKE